MHLPLHHVLQQACLGLVPHVGQGGQAQPRTHLQAQPAPLGLAHEHGSAHSWLSCLLTLMLAVVAGTYQSKSLARTCSMVKALHATTLVLLLSSAVH